MTFEEVIAAWLRSNGRGSVVTVTKCDGVGSDWNGSTEAGFFESFAVDVTWVDAVGVTRRDSIVGDEMGSLWMHVVGAWANA